MLKTEKMDKNTLSQLRPFSPFWKRLNPAFTELCKTLLYLIRRQGIDRVGEKNALKEREVFLSAVHDGWKAAQKTIAFEIILRLDEISTLESQKKEARINKEKDKASLLVSKIKKLNLEIQILRRFIDTIVWTMYGFEHSTIRRLPLPDGNDNLSKKNIIDSMIAADQMNIDPLTVAITSDLTTFVHAGDIVKYNMLEGVSLVEVKTGEKNISFSHAAQFSVESKCPYFDENFTKDFDEKDKKHYERTKKQWERLSDITSTLNTGEGFDHYHKTKVRIIDNNFTPAFYTEKLVNSWRKLNLGKNWDIHVVDECLFIGAYKKSEMGFVGFNSWMKISNINGIVHNISDTIHNIFAQPLFCLNIPDMMIEEIISGELIIVLCIDYEKFKSLGDKKYPNLFSLTRLKGEKISSADCVMIKNKALYTTTDGQINYVGTGLISRIVFDFQLPSNIIDWIYKTSDQRKKTQKEKNILKKKTAIEKRKKQRNAKKMRKMNTN